MAFRFVAFATLLAAANAGVVAPVATSVAYGSHATYTAPIAKVATPLTYAAPIAKVVAKTVVSEEYDPNPQYSYGYDINDALTGDSKNQQETRNGDAVQGSYSLTDADGFRRTVEYTADPINGFNAVVRREPLVAKVAAPVAYAAPVAKVAYAAPVAKISAPLTYAAPVAKVATYAAPVARVATVSHHGFAAPVAKVAAPLAYAAPVANVGTVTHHGFAAPVAKVAAYAAPAAYYH